MREDLDREWARCQPIWRDFYEPNGIDDQLRAMFYDVDGTFLGFIAACRPEAGAFSEADQCALNAKTSTILRDLRLAWAAERLNDSRSIHAVADEQGSVLYASRYAREWLTARRIDLLRRAVLQWRARVIDGMRFEMMSMEQTGWTFLTANPVPGFRISTNTLSATQLQIARLATEGLSNGEISGHCGMSVSNVKYHLRIIFEQLGVDSRTQLSKFREHLLP